MSGGIQIVILRAGVNPYELVGELAYIIRGWSKQFPVSRSDVNFGRVEAGCSSEPNEKIIDLPAVGVTAIQHVFDAGIRLQILVLVFLDGLFVFLVEIADLLDARVNLAELGLGRIAWAQDLGYFLLERLFLVDELLEVVAPFFRIVVPILGGRLGG